eukprot:369278_1
MLMVTSWFSFENVSSHSNKTSNPPHSTKTIEVGTETETEDTLVKLSDVEDQVNVDAHDITLSKWQEASTGGKLKLWCKDIWKRKSVYLPLTAHLSDTATDFAAVIEFYDIAINHSPDDCGINVWYLFGLSICSMLIYRIISSITIWRITRSWKRAIAQFIDIELFRILWLSHRLGLQSKSSPQRLISVMEAVFEAAPQSIIQATFLLKTQRFAGIIAVSSLLSFINLTMTIIGDDKQFLEIGFRSSCAPSISLHIFRILDIPSTILIYVFIWFYVNGYALTVTVLIDSVIAMGCLRSQSKQYVDEYRTNRTTQNVEINTKAFKGGTGNKCILFKNLFHIRKKRRKKRMNNNVRKLIADAETPWIEAQERMSFWNNILMRLEGKFGYVVQ